MLDSEYTTIIHVARDAYRNGQPVVVLSRDDAPVHGHGFLKTIVELEMPLTAVVIRGVSVNEWNASDLPELLAAMEQLLMEGVPW